jgi:hypothetical protein
MELKQVQFRKGEIAGRRLGELCMPHAHSGGWRKSNVHATMSLIAMLYPYLTDQFVEFKHRENSN